MTIGVPVGAIVTVEVDGGLGDDTHKAEIPQGSSTEVWPISTRQGMLPVTATSGSLVPCAQNDGTEEHRGARGCGQYLPTLAAPGWTAHT